MSVCAWRKARGGRIARTPSGRLIPAQRQSCAAHTRVRHFASVRRPLRASCMRCASRLHDCAYTGSSGSHAVGRWFPSRVSCLYTIRISGTGTVVQFSTAPRDPFGAPSGHLPFASRSLRCLTARRSIAPVGRAHPCLNWPLGPETSGGAVCSVELARPYGLCHGLSQAEIGNGLITSHQCRSEHDLSWI